MTTPSSLPSPAGAAAHYLGIEIGGSKLQIFTGNAQGRVLERRRFTVQPEAGAPAIRAQLAAALREIDTSALTALGAGFGGPVDHRTGRLCCSHQIAGWSDFDLCGWLSDVTGLPATVENDANTAALGEAMLGAGVGHDPVFYVTLGSGVGGGLVCQGRIYRGAPPGEAEVGHLRLDPHGTIVENRCSGWAVNRRIREAIADLSGSPLAELARQDPGHEARHLRHALDLGDPIAVRILAETAADLAFALSHVTHLMHPEVFVLGGGLAQVGEPLRAAVAEHLFPLLMHAFRPGPAIALAALGEDAVPVGALLLARDTFGGSGSAHSA
jgi:glucokinase